MLWRESFEEDFGDASGGLTLDGVEKRAGLAEVGRLNDMEMQSRFRMLIDSLLSMRAESRSACRRCRS